MKIFRLIAVSTLLAAITALSAFAQAPARTTPARPTTTPATTAPAPAQTALAVPDSKIAIVNTEAFRDEKQGITRYVNAIKLLEKEFKPRQDELVNMQTRLKALATEIEKLSGAAVVSQESIRAKQDEAEQIQRDMKRKKEDADALFEKRYESVVSPVSQDIGNSIIAFAQARGITMTFDISKLAQAGVVLTVNPAMDITQAFIAEYNRTHPATASIQ